MVKLFSLLALVGLVAGGCSTTERLAGAAVAMSAARMMQPRPAPQQVVYVAPPRPIYYRPVYAPAPRPMYTAPRPYYAPRPQMHCVRRGWRTFCQTLYYR